MYYLKLFLHRALHKPHKCCMRSCNYHDNHERLGIDVQELAGVVDIDDPPPPYDRELLPEYSKLPPPITAPSRAIRQHHESDVDRDSTLRDPLVDNLTDQGLGDYFVIRFGVAAYMMVLCGVVATNCDLDAGNAGRLVSMVLVGIAEIVSVVRLGVGIRRRNVDAAESAQDRAMESEEMGSSVLEKAVSKLPVLRELFFWFAFLLFAIEKLPAVK
jgi:hypothetical protein